jgi:hypothetical protein
MIDTLISVASPSSVREQILKDARIGDAVLALWARTKILLEGGRVDGEKYTRLTSNRFLNALGEPSHVEARIGRVYEVEGLAAAFEWIEKEIGPLFNKQEAKRKRRQ